MLNSIVKFFTGKELTLFNRHRNSDPLVSDPANKENYYFIPATVIWRTTGIFGRNSRLRYKVMAGILSLIRPVYIIGINWTAKRDTLYRLWCEKNGRHFIVIQHGAHHGGTLLDIREKYINCTVYLAWSQYFKEEIDENNAGKAYKSIAFGNPCYNVYDRNSFKYPDTTQHSILIAVSLIKGERLQRVRELIARLRELGFSISIKEHNYQPRYSEPIDPKNKSTLPQGTLLNPILQKQSYDIVVTDVSSAMLDCIFFKNRVIYFSPDDGSQINNNKYGEFLENMAEEPFLTFNQEQILQFVDIQAQEALLECLVKTQNTSNNLNVVEKNLNDKEAGLDINEYNERAVINKENVRVGL